MKDAEAARRRDVKERRKELLLSTERPFVGLQERTDADGKTQARKFQKKAEDDEYRTKEILSGQQTQILQDNEKSYSRRQE